MVELQRGLNEIRDAGAELVALSYDEPDALLDFAEAYGIEFPMLSDPDSEVIRRFGILNTLIPEDDHPWFGIPFPGVYVTDADGVITAKFFEDSLVLRPGVDQLVRSVRGEQVEIAARADGPVDSVECSIAFDDTPAAGGIVRELVVRLRVPEGQHLYGDPVPDGMVATHVEIEPVDDLVVRPTIAPPTSPHTLGGTGETLQIYDGDVMLRVPISHHRAGRDVPPVPVRGRVRWQACDDDVCHLPASQSFEFELAQIRGTRPTFGEDAPMDSARHLQRMADRRHVG